MHRTLPVRRVDHRATSVSPSDPPPLSVTELAAAVSFLHEHQPEDDGKCSEDDLAEGIAVDGAGSAYVTGITDSSETSFPVVGGPDSSFNGGA